MPTLQTLRVINIDRQSVSNPEGNNNNAVTFPESRPAHLANSGPFPERNSQ
jgi:hypothetical protein